MRRECNYEENRIIKGNSINTLIHPAMYSEVKKRMILPVILGLIFGLILGAAVALGVDVGNSAYIKLILVLCIVLMEGIFVGIINAITYRRSRKNAIPGDRFWISGGTFNGYATYNDETYIVFHEDNARDEYGNMYCVQCPAPLRTDMKLGERIIIVYTESGGYIPMKITEITRNMVPMQYPQDFSGIDWSRVRKVPHPNVFFIDKTSYQVNENEIDEIRKKANSLKHIRRLNRIGIGAMGFLIFLIFGLIFIFIVAEVTQEPAAVLSIGAIFIIISILLTMGFVKLVNSGRLRKINNMMYRQKVMFIKRDVEWVNNYTVENIVVYEYENGSMKLNTYSYYVSILLPKDLPYGTLIYKYYNETPNNKKKYFTFCTI